MFRCFITVNVYRSVHCRDPISESHWKLCELLSHARSLDRLPEFGRVYLLVLQQVTFCYVKSIFLYVHMRRPRGETNLEQLLRD